MNQIVTVLEACVAAERVADLQAAYAEAGAGPFPPGFIRSTLLQLKADATQWRIETIWQSHDALAAMRGAGKPRGVQIFEAAGANPSVAIYEAIASLEPPTDAA
jgi:heme-degrading monooxygenase HmoA